MVPDTVGADAASAGSSMRMQLFSDAGTGSGISAGAADSADRGKGAAPCSGEARIELHSAGAYAVTFQSASEGERITHQSAAPAVTCRLQEEGGDAVPLVPDYLPATWLRLMIDPGAGEQLYSTTIDAPGLYVLSCTSGGRSGGQAGTAALGQNAVFELLRFAAHTTGTAALLVLEVSAAAVLAVVTLFLAGFQRLKERKVLSAAP